jgi:hypothetical protein
MHKMAAYRYTAKPPMKSTWRVSRFSFLGSWHGHLAHDVRVTGMPVRDGLGSRDTEFMGSDAHATVRNEKRAPRAQGR